jgi:hypothetical protein
MFGTISRVTNRSWPRGNYYFKLQNHEKVNFKWCCLYDFYCLLRH